MKKILSILLLFLPIASLACSVSIGFAPEEHKSLVHRYFPSQAQRKVSYLALLKQFKTLSDCHLVWKKYKDMHEEKEALIHKKVDVGWLKLFNLYLAHKHNPEVHPILTDLSEDKITRKLSPYYNSYILTSRGKHGLKSLADITPANIAFLHPHSSSGFIYPIMFLIKQHILTVKEAQAPIFINNYDLLYRKLFGRSRIRVIATWDNVILRDGKQSKIKVLKVLHGLPNPAYVESHPLPKRILNALIVSLTHFEKTRAISPLLAKQGIIPSSEVNYQKAYRLFDHYCAILPKYCNV